MTRAATPGCGPGCSTRDWMCWPVCGRASPLPMMGSTTGSRSRSSCRPPSSRPGYRSGSAPSGETGAPPSRHSLGRSFPDSSLRRAHHAEGPPVGRSLRHGVSGHRGRLRRRAGGPRLRSKLRPYRSLCQGGTDLVDPAYPRALDRLAGRDQSGNSARTSRDLALSSGPDRLRLTGACRRYGRGGPGEYGPGTCE